MFSERIVSASLFRAYVGRGQTRHLYEVTMAGHGRDSRHPPGDTGPPAARHAGHEPAQAHMPRRGRGRTAPFPVPERITEELAAPPPGPVPRLDADRLLDDS
ncbi:hypothetical protein GCM10009560_15450 [Nonomuraea longicatena]|uniref:Uncharacterized protein n=1 Tax=Nonomuraea longicatena TaxID=83682 RepID=A0ABP3ZCE9_9ACTN